MFISSYMLKDALERLERIIKENTTPEQWAKIEKGIKDEFGE